MGATVLLCFGALTTHGGASGYATQPKHMGKKWQKKRLGRKLECSLCDARWHSSKGTWAQHERGCRHLVSTLRSLLQSYERPLKGEIVTDKHARAIETRLSSEIVQSAGISLFQSASAGLSEENLRRSIAPFVSSHADGAGIVNLSHDYISPLALLQLGAVLLEAKPKWRFGEISLGTRVVSTGRAEISRACASLCVFVSAMVDSGCSARMLRLDVHMPMYGAAQINQMPHWVNGTSVPLDQYNGSSDCWARLVRQLERAIRNDCLVELDLRFKECSSMPALRDSEAMTGLHSWSEESSRRRRKALLCSLNRIARVHPNSVVAHMPTHLMSYLLQQCVPICSTASVSFEP